jgi:hypothetical protein
MTELIIYAVLFLLLFAHALMAGKMYGIVHRDENLQIQDKNNWKLKALIFPIYYWQKYREQKNQK